jgi:hypothetical protein
MINNDLYLMVYIAGGREYRTHVEPKHIYRVMQEYINDIGLDNIESIELDDKANQTSIELLGGEQ